MKILWITGTASSKHKTYGGGGWIRSLSSRIVQSNEMELAWAYFYDADVNCFKRDEVWHYPMYLPEESRIGKLLRYWTGKGEKELEEKKVTLLKSVINQYQPDIIQVFVTESNGAFLIGKTEVPVVLYLQGLVNPIYNAYYPAGMTDEKVKAICKDKNEWILNNGIVYRHKELKRLAEREKWIFNEVKYVIGRTQFDNQISRLYSPNSKYYKLNESMRSSFYCEEMWKKHKGTLYKIFSTMSSVTYKGLDVILKTAKELKENHVQFEWRIAGVTNPSKIIHLFERFTGIRANEVNVICLGILNENDLKRYLLDSDVYVHPSYIDNSPNSVGEAQLLGVPVVACNVGGVSDFVKDGVTGKLVPANDPYDLAYLLMEDMRNPYLYKYSENTRLEAYKCHDRDAIFEDLCIIYKDVMAQEKKQSSKSK